MQVIGLKILDSEMMRDGERAPSATLPLTARIAGRRMVPFFAVGFTVVGVFVAFAIITPAAARRMHISGNRARCVRAEASPSSRSCVSAVECARTCSWAPAAFINVLTAMCCPLVSIAV